MALGLELRFRNSTRTAQPARRGWVAELILEDLPTCRHGVARSRRPGRRRRTAVVMCPCRNQAVGVSAASALARQPFDDQPVRPTRAGNANRAAAVSGGRHVQPLWQRIGRTVTHRRRQRDRQPTSTRRGAASFTPRLGAIQPVSGPRASDVKAWRPVPTAANQCRSTQPRTTRDSPATQARQERTGTSAPRSW